MVLLIKQCEHVYACYLCGNFFLFVSRKKLLCFFLEFNSCVCKFDRNKNKNLLKKKINEDFIKNYDENTDKRYFLEVDVEYPKNLYNLHSDLPFYLKD